ncbi:hypothetical protein LINPERPRIM_LOCUS19822, partial [Linum perenne]
HLRNPPHITFNNQPLQNKQLICKSLINRPLLYLTLNPINLTFYLCPK